MYGDEKLDPMTRRRGDVRGGMSIKLSMCKAKNVLIKTQKEKGRRANGVSVTNGDYTGKLFIRLRKGAHLQ